MINKFVIAQMRHVVYVDDREMRSLQLKVYLTLAHKKAHLPVCLSPMRSVSCYVTVRHSTLH